MALNPICEYFGVMVGQDAQTDRITGDGYFRGYAIARRDRAPLIETEDFRDEAGAQHLGRLFAAAFRLQAQGGPRHGRGPSLGHVPLNSETFSLAAATRYASYVRNEISNTDPAHSKWSATPRSISRTPTRMGGSRAATCCA